MCGNVSTDQRKRVAVFPGTFDPFTKGHLSLVQKIGALHIFDVLHILVANNPKKTPMFSMDKRVEIVQTSCKGLSNMFEELHVSKLDDDSTTLDFCVNVGANALVRGLRDSSDLAYEQNLELINKHISPSVKTIYIMADPETAYISSTLIREALRYGDADSGRIVTLFATSEAYLVARLTLSLNKELTC